MKRFRIIIIWSITALLIQSGVFFTVDKYYEKTLLNTKVKEVIVVKPKVVVKSISIKIPTTAKEIKASFDGKYLSYYDSSKLTIINTITGTTNVMESETKYELIYSKWLPDVNSMILCERNLNSKKTIDIFTYNANNNSKQASTDSDNNDITFTLTNSKDTISDIEMSTTMGIFYIKVVKSSLKNEIFNNDVNGNIVSIFTNKNIGNINAFRLKPNLIYEDASTNLIKVTKTSWSAGKMKACLINTDNEDNIYLGTLLNGKIEKIMYGSTDKAIDEWMSLSLQVPADKKDIIVTKNGQIYLDSSVEGYVTNQVSKKKTTYKGTILLITDKKIITDENGNINTIDLT